MLIACLGAGPLLAGNGLERLDQRHDLDGWEAVGRIDIGRSGYCTGVLIAPELVLTAAHCVYDAAGRPHPASSFTFRAGLHDGLFVASRAVLRVVAHPGYRPGAGVDYQNVRHDAALLELATGVPTSTAAPFALLSEAAGGDRVSVVSYGQGRDDAPSWQRDCGVLEQAQGILVFDCDVTHGSSGAPVFASVGGQSRILSLISSGSFEPGRTVAFGMELSELVGDLRSMLNAAPRSAQQTTAVKRLQVGGRNTGSGAKFVRP